MKNERGRPEKDGLSFWAEDKQWMNTSPIVRSDGEAGNSSLSLYPIFAHFEYYASIYLKW